MRTSGAVGRDRSQGVKPAKPTSITRSHDLGAEPVPQTGEHRDSMVSKSLTIPGISTPRSRNRQNRQSPQSKFSAVGFALSSGEEEPRRWAPAFAGVTNGDQALAILRIRFHSSSRTGETDNLDCLISSIF